MKSRFVPGATVMRGIAVLVAVGALGLTGVAWAAQAGTYSGHTSQHKGTIILKVSHGKVVHVTFVDGTGVGPGCSSAGAVQPQFPVGFASHMTINAHGKFAGKASPRDQEVFKITGRFKGGRVSGSFTDSIPLGQLTSHGIRCSSGKVTYTATLAKSG